MHPGRVGGDWCWHAAPWVAERMFLQGRESTLSVNLSQFWYCERPASRGMVTRWE